MWRGVGVDVHVHLRACLCVCVHVCVCVLDDGKESRVFATASTVLVVLVVYTTMYLTHIWFSDYDWFL